MGFHPRREKRAQAEVHLHGLNNTQQYYGAFNYSQDFMEKAAQCGAFLPALPSAAISSQMNWEEEDASNFLQGSYEQSLGATEPVYQWRLRQF